MAQEAKVYGMTSDSALWFASALESASDLHWVGGAPPVIAERLQAIREAASRFHALASELSAILMLEEVEGVEGESVEYDVGEDEDDDDEREGWR